jgi:crotonobetainyl-CoA:carnitine CoA-transferase CaiB-like acyl-CoA transferase
MTAVVAAACDRTGPGRAGHVLARLPEGAIDTGLASWLGGLASAGAPAGLVEATPQAVAELLVLPVILADHWPDPSDPLPVGDGAVNADLIDDDRDTLACLRQALFTTAGAGEIDAERFAAEAQRWRLPVTPYRPLPPPATPGPRDPNRSDDGRDEPSAASPTSLARTSGHASRREPLAGRLVVDLSALWAGPLATALLARLGATVVKLDPSCRRDGFRAHPRLYNRLNGDKEIVDLDLRRPADRQRFERLVAGADLVVDSFSRRVMPNLGYGPDQLRSLRPEIATLSLVAFPAGSPEQDWVAYGTGVHAASGLAAPEGHPAQRRGADGRRARYRAAPIAYPDALAGLEAFAVATGLLSRPGPVAHREVSLAGAILPLVERAIRAGGDR